jgi:FMN-dependent NADH-azoreductase
MKNILLIQSSPRGSESYSQRVAESIVNDAAPYRSHPKVGAHYRPLVAEENLPDAN